MKRMKGPAVFHGRVFFLYDDCRKYFTDRLFIKGGGRVNENNKLNTKRNIIIATLRILLL